MGHPLGKAGALVRNDIRHIGAAKGVDNKHGTDNHQRRAKSAACGLEQRNQADNGDNQIHLGRITHTLGQAFIEDK